MNTDLPILTPAPEIIPRILDDLCDPDLTLREIAMKAKTTVEALSLWMASDEIRSRINLIQSTIAQRTRLAATCFLPGVVRTVNRIIDEYNDEESNLPFPEGRGRGLGGIGGSIGYSLQSSELRRRSRESARRACSLLLRLARFNHEPVRRSSPGGGGGRRRRPEGDARTPQAPARAALTLHALRELLTSQLQPESIDPPVPLAVPLAVAALRDCQCDSPQPPGTACPQGRPADGTSQLDPAVPIHPNGHSSAIANEHWP